MSGLFRENVQETATTEGQIDFVLAGAVTGARTFDAGFGTGEKIVAYKIRNAVVDGEFEVGICPQDGTALKRTDGVVLSSSNANALVDWGPGTKNVWCELPADSANDFDMIKPVGVFGGTANALTCTPNVPVTEWIDGLALVGRLSNTNTGSVTVTPAGGFVTGKTAQFNGANLVEGQLVDDTEVMFIYRSSLDVLQVVFLEAGGHAIASMVMGGVISPSQITADQNDYNPTGISTAELLRLTSDASRNITSIVGGRSNRQLTIINVGSNAIVLKQDNGSSGTAANRFDIGSDVTLAADDGFTLRYDATSQRWRKVVQTVVSGLPKGYFNGGTLANNGSDAVNDLDITAFAGRNAANTADVIVAAMTKQIDATWAAGTNAGGRDSGDNLTGAKWFHVYGFLRGGGTGDYFISTSTTPTLPDSGTTYVLLGSIYWDGSTIVAFTQVGDDVLWTVRVNSLNSGTIASGGTTVTLRVPTGYKVLARFQANQGASGETINFQSPDQTSTAPVSASNPVGNLGGNFNQMHAWQLIRTNTSGQIIGRGSGSSSTAVSIDTIGWFYIR